MCSASTSKGVGEVIYPPLLNLADATAYRDYFERIYCQGVIRTFDGIEVRFRKDDFDHCCFESSRRNNIKDLFSIKRAQRLHWIKVALEDATCERYLGWDSKRKRYDLSRRVVLVMGEYVVVIRLVGQRRATFVTAFVADPPDGSGQPSTIEMIRRSPRCA